MNLRSRLWSMTLGALALPIGIERVLSASRGGLPWYVTGLFWMTGLLAAAVVWRMLSKKWKGDIAREKDRELDALFASAKQALEVVRTQPISKRGVVLILGPGGSAKTSSVANSGLAAELLAGPGAGKDDVPPATQTANIWYAEGRVLVEAAGELLEAPDRWKRLASHIQPSRLGAAVLRRPQPPRSAVLCIDAEFLTGTRGRDLDRVGRELRERLHEMAKVLGVRLPVYVMFTRSDRIPNFEAYVGPLEREEAEDVVGATLRLPTGSADPASRVEEIRRAVVESFDEIVRGLSLRRGTQLARQDSLNDRAAAYEFPREMQKLRERVVELLTEVFRPAQLHDDPILRGFYFSGVRPVVSDAPPEAWARSRRPDPAPAGATSLFLGAPSAPRGRTAEAAGGRRIPQWTFLTRFFPDVVFADRIAEELTRTGTRTDLLRQVAYGLVSLVAFTLIVGSTVSFTKNRALAESVAETSARAATLSATMPAEEKLPRLDTLTSLVSRLRRFEAAGPPTSYRFGLYTGDELYPVALGSFAEAFHAVLGDGLRRRLEEDLSSATLANDYLDGFAALKSYQLLTGAAEPRLTEQVDWFSQDLGRRARSAEPGADSTSVARAARVYADLRAQGDLGPEDGAPGVIARARATLLESNDERRVYERALRAGSGAGEVGELGYTVPGAFTPDGWRAVRQELREISRGAGNEEDWVLGTAMPIEQIRAVQGRVLELYQGEYRQYWNGYLDHAASRSFDNSRELTAALEFAARHTGDPDLPESIRAHFQPVQVAADPDQSGEYMDALSELLFSFRQAQVRRDPVADAGALDAAARTESEADKLARMFAPEAVETGRTVEQMLRRPARSAMAVVQQGPAIAARELARDFCRRDFSPVFSRFPFTSVDQSAAPRDVAALFHPGDGGVWLLGNALVERQHALRSGEFLRVNPGSPVRIQEQYLDFVNGLATLGTEGFYAGGPDRMEISFRLSLDVRPPVEWAEFRLGDQVGRWTQNRQQSHSFRWDDSREESTLRVQVAGRQIEVASAPPDPWSIFRVFDRAEWPNAAPPASRYEVVWPIPGSEGRVTGTVTFSEARRPILNPDYLARFSCSEAILR